MSFKRAMSLRLLLEMAIGFASKLPQKRLPHDLIPAVTSVCAGGRGAVPVQV